MVLAHITDIDNDTPNFGQFLHHHFPLFLALLDLLILSLTQKVFNVEGGTHIPHFESLENETRGWRDIGYRFSQGAELLQG